MKSLKKRLLAVGLCVALTVNTTSTAFAAKPGGGAGGGGTPSQTRLGFFDGLDAFGNATATIGCILNVGSVLANADWDDPGGVCLDLVDTIFGTSFGGDPVQESLDAIYDDVEEIKGTTNDIKNTVDYLKANSVYVNQQLSVINGSLRTVNSQLTKQTQMLSEIKTSLKDMNDEMTQSFNDLNALINTNTDTLISVVHQSTTEIKMTTELNNALTNYVTNYSKLYTYDNNILNSLSAMQDSYTAFYDEIQKLDNGKSIIEALNKVSLKEDSVDSLSKKDQALLKETYVTVGGKEQQVLKFHQDFIKSLMEFVAGTGDNTHSVFTLNGNVGNLGDTVIEMGDYLTASNKTFNALTGDRGIGELYYVYRTYMDKNSMIVHEKYKSFMDCMIAQYMTTAWLAEMAYGYRIADEANGNANETVIRGYEQYLNDIHTQMIKVSAYYEYEYRKCINDYDYGGEDVYGHSQDVIKYGNSENGGKWEVVGKNTMMTPSGLSEKNITLALGEEFDLHYYYRYADVTRKKGIKWTSSNPKVAAVDNFGEVLGLSRGVAVIKAEYSGTSAECVVSIGDVMAIGNDDGVNRYHYFEYYSQGGKWVTDDTPLFEVASDRGYDFYYGVTTYTTDTIELSERVRSASIIKTTGMTDENMNQFTWFTTGDGAVQLDDYDVSAVSGGWTEVIGYKKDEATHTYDFIGIPVHSTMDTLFKDTAIDYSTYTEISSAEDLIALSNNPDGWGENSKYVLTADIDLGGMEWNPIGYSLGVGPYSGEVKFEQSNASLSVNGGVSTAAGMGASAPFSGTFDGNGHTISNFKITKIPRGEVLQTKYEELFYEGSNKELSKNGRNMSLVAVGLFGYVYGANISNLNVVDANIDIDTSKPTGITLDGNEISYDKTFTVFAGSLAGASRWNSSVLQYEKIYGKYIEVAGENGENKDVDYKALAEYFYETYDVPDRFKEYYNDFKNDTSSKDDPDERFARLCMSYALWNESRNTKEIALEGCYATGKIKINNTTSEGGAYAGMISGGSDASVIRCNTLGSIDATASYGFAGGISGYQSVNCTTRINDNVSNVDISALNGMSAGGLCGTTEGDWVISYDVCSLNEDDSAELTENKLKMHMFFVMMFEVAHIGSMHNVDEEYPNAQMNRNQVLGNVTGSVHAGGLVGYKTACMSDKDYMVIMDYDMDEATSLSNYTAISYNIDMKNNYVVSDVTSNNGYTGGLIGLCDLYEFTIEEDSNNNNNNNNSNEGDKEEETKAELIISKGEISKNYYTGKVNGGPGGYAAGLIGMVNSDYSELKQNISAATSLVGGGVNKVAYVINGRENGLPLVTGEGEDWNVNGALCYTGIKEWAGDDGATKGGADVFDDPKTYTKIFGSDNFLELSGGLKDDGESGLDLKGGLIPTKLENRFRFPIETVPVTYHQGDSFVALDSIYKYTGTGTELIKQGVESTTPDMSKIGIQTVTVTYGDYTEEYDICIYPTAGYLKIKGKPDISKDGKTINSGKVILYANGDKTGKTVDISECIVIRDKDNIFTIIYGKYTTALRPVIARVFTNNVKTGIAEELGREFYTQGVDADVSALVPKTRTVSGKKYKLLGTSQDVKFKAINDVYVLSYYGSDGSSKGDNSGTVDGPKVGTKLSDKKYIYVVTKSGSKDGKTLGTLEVIGLKKKSLKVLKIAESVKIGGVKYYVTSVGKAAFKGNKKATKVYIGKKVKTIKANAFAKMKKLKAVIINSTVLRSIGKSAFAGDKKLKKIIIKSTKLKSVGKKAFKGVKKKCKAKVPKKKKKAYKKTLKKGGFKGKIK